MRRGRAERRIDNEQKRQTYDDLLFKYLTETYNADPKKDLMSAWEKTISRSELITYKEPLNKEFIKSGLMRVKIKINDMLEKQKREEGI